MATIKVQSREEDVCIVALDSHVVIADVTRAEAEAILAAFDRVLAREKPKRSRRP